MFVFVTPGLTRKVGCSVVLSHRTFDVLSMKSRSLSRYYTHALLYYLSVCLRFVRAPVLFHHAACAQPDEGLGLGFGLGR